MKTLIKLVLIIAFVTIIGFTMAGCNDASDEASLEGTWTTTEEGVIIDFKFNKGNIEITLNDSLFERGIYSVNGNRLTVTPTHIWGDCEILGIELEAEWYTITEFFSAIGLDDELPAEIEAIIPESEIVFIYSVKDDKLTLTMDLTQVGRTGTETVVLLRK